MIAQTKKDLAIFKKRSTTIIPFRPGPIQCIRSCPHCTDRRDLVPTVECEAITALKTFKDISSRMPFWHSHYRSIQYQEGQIYLLKHAIEQHAPKTLIVVGASSYRDIEVFQRVLDHADILDRNIADVAKLPLEIINLLEKSSTLVLPLHYETCFDGSPRNLSDYETIGELLHQLFLLVENSEFDINIASVIITRDHGRSPLQKQGSMCIQIMEPFTIRDYCRNVIISDKESHLLQHIYHDISHHAAILPTHLVAFLTLYLERQQGPTLEDLIYYVDWFRRTSLEYKIYFGFTGDSSSAVLSGLHILRDVLYLSKNGGYQVKDIERVTSYAQTITPMVAIYGCVARAILREFNNLGKYHPQCVFPYQVPIKVSLEKVRKIATTYISQIDDDICFKRPCRTIDNCVTEALSNMQTQGRFFKLDGAKSHSNKTRYWAGEFSDDEYSPGVVETVWIVISEKVKRRDRLNLFMNAIGEC